MSDFGAQISIIVYPISARHGKILRRGTAVGIVQHHRRSRLAAAHAPQPGVRIRGEAMHPNRQRQGLLQSACGLEISTPQQKTWQTSLVFFFVTHDSMIISYYFQLCLACICFRK